MAIFGLWKILAMPLTNTRTCHDTFLTLDAKVSSSRVIEVSFIFRVGMTEASILAQNAKTHKVHQIQPSHSESAAAFLPQNLAL